MADDRHVRTLDFIERETYRLKGYTPPEFFTRNRYKLESLIMRKMRTPTEEARQAHQYLVDHEETIWYGEATRHTDKMRGPNLPCAVWMGPWKKGRPLLRAEDRQISARIFSYTLHIREVPLNCTAVPLCGHNDCVYPGHLAVRRLRAKPHGLKKLHRDALRLLNEGQWKNMELAVLHGWSQEYVWQLRSAGRTNYLEEFERTGVVVPPMYRDDYCE